MEFSLRALSRPQALNSIPYETSRAISVSSRRSTLHSVRKELLITNAIQTPEAVVSNEGQTNSSSHRIFRDDFPILDQTLEGSGKKLIYLDSAATSQKPLSVLKAMQDYYEGYNSNVHRGVHTLAALATDAYEASREKVSNFINSPSSRQLIYTRNASEAINLVSYSWGAENLHRGDEVILSVAEHHSNIVPWQILAKRTGIRLRFAELDSSESVDIEQVLSFISNRTKLVSLHHVSNALGSVNPLEEIITKAHRYGAKVLLDACQSVPHMPVDVQALNVDFLAASGHKMCGPTGIGFLYGRKEILESMPPFMGGGEMIDEVYLDHSTFAEPPSRFEAGTPAIAEAIGLGAAVDYLNEIGMEQVHQIERELGSYLYNKLSEVKGVRIYGPPPSEERERAALCSFNVKGVHPTDLSAFLDQQHGIAIRTGHHCTQPLHRHLGINATARASLHIYNTKEEIDTFIEALKDTIDFFTSYSDVDA